QITECPECGSKSLVRDYDRAEIFCADCGLVITENIVDLGPEWRKFDSEQKSKRARTGAPMTYRIHDKGLSTIVSPGPGMSLGGYKLQKWQQRTHIASTSERSFVSALTEIDRMASALRLPMNIREQASMLYRKAMKKRLTRGRSIESITSALLYITCRQYGVPRTLEEITEISRVGKKEISRAYRFLLRELDLKIEPSSPVDFVPRFCSELNLDGDVKSKAIAIIKKAKEAGLTNGPGPIGIAAGAIYMAALISGKHCTQKKVSNVTGVTEVTVRNRYKKMSEELEIKELAPFL
ncbi:MAG: transcription initiation factor IIB, partial [Methanophagales archaeon]|nr:transcription initiation factor IIB [Methanophagales archaeon]